MRIKTCFATSCLEAFKHMKPRPRAPLYVIAPLVSHVLSSDSHLLKTVVLRLSPIKLATTKWSCRKQHKFFWQYIAKNWPALGPCDIHTKKTRIYSCFFCQIQVSTGQVFTKYCPAQQQQSHFTSLSHRLLLPQNDRDSEYHRQFQCLRWASRQQPQCPRLSCRCLCQSEVIPLLPLWTNMGSYHCQIHCILLASLISGFCAMCCCVHDARLTICELRAEALAEV